MYKKRRVTTRDSQTIWATLYLWLISFSSGRPWFYHALVDWQVQFLDRCHLLIKFGSVDGVVCSLPLDNMKSLCISCSLECVTHRSEVLTNRKPHSYRRTCWLSSCNETQIHLTKRLFSLFSIWRQRRFLAFTRYWNFPLWHWTWLIWSKGGEREMGLQWANAFSER